MDDLATVNNADMHDAAPPASICQKESIGIPAASLLKFIPLLTLGDQNFDMNDVLVSVSINFNTIDDHNTLFAEVYMLAIEIGNDLTMASGVMTYHIKDAGSGWQFDPVKLSTFYVYTHKGKNPMDVFTNNELEASGMNPKSVVSKLVFDGFSDPMAAGTTAGVTVNYKDISLMRVQIGCHPG